MPVDELLLDDLTWEDLVLAARNRIPAASRGLWTLHAPVDPGMTLLELFAAQLEERLYWLNQPCDTRARAILKLLGVSPRAAVPAATVLAVFSEDESFFSVPRQTKFNLQPPPESATFRWSPDNASLTFTTRHRILCFPIKVHAQPLRWDPECVELEVGGQSRSLELYKGKAPYLWIGADDSLDVDITLHLRAALPTDANGYLSLLLDLETPDQILPQWAPGAVAPHADAEVSWKYWAGSDGYLPFDAKAVKDGTKSLRRSGVVLLPVRGNMGWQPVGENRYRIRLSIRAAHYTVPPRIRQIVPNAVIASHRRHVEGAEANAGALAAALGDWNRVQTPNPSWQLPAPEGSVLPHTVDLRLKREPAKQFESWRRVDDLLFSGPGDRHYSVDRTTSELRFGNGYHGRLPVGNATQARLTFHVGGGSAGNLSAGRTWEESEGKRRLAVNVVAATGGADAETLEDAAKRAAHEWRRPTRSVIAADFEYLAQHVPGAAIGRAKAAVGRHPRFPCTIVEGAVTVFIVPDVPEPPRADWLARPDYWSALKPDRPTVELVRARLDRARLVTQEVFVAAPAYEAVRITVLIGGVPVDADRIRKDVTLEMLRFFSPLWGGPDGTGWPFGEDIYPSAVMKHAQQALPDGLTVTGVSIERQVDPDEECDATEPTATQCEPMPIGTFNLPNLKSVQLRFTPTPQTEGGLG